MRTEQLHYLEALAQYPSFNSASSHLNISFQALFRSINNLEQELGLVLLERTPRGVHLTADGNRLIDAAHFLFSEIEDMKRQGQEQKVSEPVVIPTTQSVITSIFQDLLIASYCHNWPVRMIELPYQDIFAALQEGRYRLIFAHQTYCCEECMNPLPEGIVYEKLLTIEHKLVASRKFKINDEPPVSLAALKDFPFAVLKRRDDEQVFLLQILRRFIPAEQIIIEENPAICDQLLLQGVALGFGTPEVCQAKHMRVIQLAEASSSTYGFMWRRDTLLNEAEQEAKQLIAQYLQKQTPVF